MTTKFLSDHARSGLAKALEHATAFSAKHGWAVGVAEMACGAALIALGVQNGAIEMGTELVATALDDTIDPGLAGAGLGSGLGVLLGLILKNIGVAALGTAVSVPAIALMGGGALLLGLSGYGLGPLVKEYLFPVPQLADFIGPASLLLVGVALVVDGARRVVKNPLVRALAARYAGGALRLAKVTKGRVLVSANDLVAHLDELAARFQLKGGRSHTVGAGVHVLVGVLGACCRLRLGRPLTASEPRNRASYQHHCRGPRWARVVSLAGEAPRNGGAVGLAENGSTAPDVQPTGQIAARCHARAHSCRDTRSVLPSSSGSPLSGLSLMSGTGPSASRSVRPVSRNK